MISVIIPCYNQEKYLREAVESVINQTYRGYEIIIVEDSSTDESLRLALDLKEQYDKIKIFKTNDIGASKARHYAIENSEGQYYLPLDADDKIDSAYLEKALEILERDEDLGFVYATSVYFNEEGRHQIVPSPEYNFFKLTQGNFISYCSLFRKEAYFDCGGYNLGNFGFYEDWELYLKLGKRGWYGKLLSEPLFYYRVHSESSMQSDRTKKMSEVYRAYLIQQYPEIHPPEWQEQIKPILEPYKEGFMASREPHKETKYTTWD